jgi:hypothetical protein
MSVKSSITNIDILRNVYKKWKSIIIANFRFHKKWDKILNLYPVTINGLFISFILRGLQIAHIEGDRFDTMVVLKAIYSVKKWEFVWH